MAKFIAGFDKMRIRGLRNYVVSLVLLDCGARIGEICNLDEDCILWDQTTLFINNGKTGQRRVAGRQAGCGVSAQV